MGQQLPASLELNLDADSLQYRHIKCTQELAQAQLCGLRGLGQQLDTRIMGSEVPVGAATWI